MTYYYKLEKIVKNGVQNNKVSGGQFITFTDKCCYESDKDGFSVNHGKLEYRYTQNSIKVYIGGSYWGSSSVFLFPSDLSALNVKVNDKETYVYKRTTPSANVETYSLVRKSGPQTNEGSGGYYSSTYSTPAQPIFSQGGFNDSKYSSDKPQRNKTVNEKRMCPACNGKGTYERNDSGYGLAKYKKRCSVCSYEYWNNIHHWHATCPTCYGNKYVE